MAFGFLAALFGGDKRLPTDRVTRVPRRAKTAAAAAIAGMQTAIDGLSALPGIADVRESKRVPRGFYGLMAEFYENLDRYQGAVRRVLGLEDVPRQGEPGGTGACYAAPLGVHTVEAINIYRAARAFRDFADVARRMGELGEQQFKDIQARHAGKDPEKIRLGGAAVRDGRLAFARRMQPCPFLDVEKQRCRIWEQRPIVCRMHQATTPPEWSRPDHEKYPRAVVARNIRPPIKVQVSLAQLDKRMMLQNSPFLYAGVLQMLELSRGQVIHEVGEAPLRVQQDGSVAARANRNVKHAKKYQKAKAKRKK